MKDKIYYILFLILACVTANAETQQHVKLAAVKLYEFPLYGVADSVTSRYYSNGLMILSGFDTDGHGTFWFVGGNPMYVTCYKGNKMLFRRQLSDTFSNFSATRLRGDSLYTVHTNRHSLLAIHKSGKGPIREIFLPYDFAVDGTAHEDEILLAKGVAGCYTGDNNDDMEVAPNSNTLIKVFDYGGNLKREYVTKKYKLDALYPVPQIKGEDLSYLYYAGKWRGLDMVYDGLPGVDRLRLFDADSKMRGCYLMPLDSTHLVKNIRDDLYPPIPVFTCEEDWDSLYHTRDLDIIRNGHFFRVWYYSGEGRNSIVVEDVDLAVAFPDIKEEE